MNFNALNGVETQDFILAKVKGMLEASGDFRPNLTFPWFRFEFSIKLVALAGKANDPQDAEVKEVKGEGEVPPENSSIPDRACTGPVETTVYEMEGEVAIPDEARIETDQPIHVEEEGAGGVKVDKPKVVRRAQARAPWLTGGEGKEEK